MVKGDSLGWAWGPQISGTLLKRSMTGDMRTDRVTAPGPGVQELIPVRRTRGSQMQCPAFRAKVEGVDPGDRCRWPSWECWAVHAGLAGMPPWERPA